jgi:LmbE family N-acetylglucosaminyl deacetylase
MLNFKLTKDEATPLKILCLGAHSDDIEIGCGGSILRILSENSNTDVQWIVFAANGERASEATLSAEVFLADAGRKKIVIKEFRDSFFPYIGGEIKQYFETIKQEIVPDQIFTHYRNDLHQDHRLLSELTWNTFRKHFILEYEVIKYDGDLGSPNFFIPLDENTSRKKVDTIFKCFRTQGSRSWFTDDVFFSMMRIRGVECNAPEKYAEAFYCRKMIL